jgi:two-component system nitrogen regulation sensor histidine kinase GlnL
MTEPALVLDATSGLRLDGAAVLGGLASPVAVIDAVGTIVYLNAAAEQMFRGSAARLVGQHLHDLLPADGSLSALVEQARLDRTAVSEYGVTIASPRIGRHYVNVQAAPIGEDTGAVVLTLHERSIADRIDRRLSHLGAARSVTAMAAMLAHEVKNPLSGIRGAAQLLEQGATSAERDLTRLICDEADRICALVDRMEAFSDDAPSPRAAVNIHQVLDHVRRLAQTGFGRHVRFVETYDPSLPQVLGNRDELVQVFLNLVKNAAEAVPGDGGEIVLATAYRHGVRFAVPRRDSRVHLPLMVSVQDNGEGIADDIAAHLFDPFVSTKPKGTGLGLALVAKIIGDHSGIIEFDSQPRRTVFRVMLPMVAESEAP